MGAKRRPQRDLAVAFGDDWRARPLLAQLRYLSVSMTPDERPTGSSVDVTHGARRRIRLAAALRDPSVRRGTSGVIETRVNDDLADEEWADPSAPRALADPVLAALWDNPVDARYDDL